RDQDVKVGKQLAKPLLAPKLYCKVATLAPFGELWIKCVLLGLQRVSKRLEEAAQELFAAATRQDSDPPFGRKSLPGKFRPGLTSAAERRAKDLRDRNA